MKTLNLIKNRNFCSKLCKKERKKYEMLDLKNVNDIKKFWKTVKPFLSDKVTISKISLEEKGGIISGESKVVNAFSNFFENAGRSLGIKGNEHSQENYDFKNPVEIAIKKFEQRPSIILINKNITKNEVFHFSPANLENNSKEIINLDNKKKELLKTFLVAASRMYQMCVVLFQLISGMERFYFKNFQKILNWWMLHVFLKRKIKLSLKITDQ